MNKKHLYLILLLMVMIFSAFTSLVKETSDNPDYSSILHKEMGSPPILSAEICNNGIDDDGDTLIDCDDPDCYNHTFIGNIDMGSLTDYLFFFADGNNDANWQGASKGYIGDVVVDGIQANERTSGVTPYAGTIYTNDNTLDAWVDLVDENDPPEVSPAQSFESLNNIALINELESDLICAFSQINALTATPGYSSISSSTLDGLNTQNSIAEIFVINVTSDFSINSLINITGDASDVFILRWDTDSDPSNGYQGQVRFQGGGAIYPLGGLKASNFIHVAGDLNSSGGGSTPPSPYPQGPRDNNGTGSLITNGTDFSGGGFFTGYWLTTGNPSNGETSGISNGIFIGGWYTTTTRFSITGGSSGVYVAPNQVALTNSITGAAGSFCTGNNVTLTSTASGGTSPYSYSWSNGLGTGASKTITPLTTTTYTVTITDASCTPITDSVTVSIITCTEDCSNGIDDDGDTLVDCDDSDCGITANAGSGISICNGASTNLNSSGGVSYLWSPSTGLSATNISNPIASPISTTTYTVTVTGGSGCTDIDDVIVTVNSLPIADASQYTLINEGKAAKLSATATGGNGNYTFHWQGMGNSPAYIVTPWGATTYTLVVTDSNGCSDSDDATLDLGSRKCSCN